MGLHLAWLRLPCPGDASAHRALLEASSFSDRSEARQWGRAQECLQAAFQLERAPAEGEGEGPSAPP
eukprot:7175319-Alexandrium_andersonii.AAC.1